LAGLPSLRSLCWAVGAACLVLAAGCGSSHSTSSTARTVPRTASVPTAGTQPAPPSPLPPLVLILPSAHHAGLLPWTPLAAMRGQVGVWIARVVARSEPDQPVTLMRFDQSLVRLALHAGSEDPGGTGLALRRRDQLA
jgi:hypothetical protein